MSDKKFSVEVTREAGYRMRVQPGREGASSFVIDESPPLGGGEGPSPTELLASAVGGCLSASLLFCLEKARIPVRDLSTRVDGTVERNDQGRLRVTGLKVILDVKLEDETSGRLGRCLDIFQDFCIVKESVRAGIPISVEVLGVPALAG